MNVLQVYFMRGGGTALVCDLGTYLPFTDTEENEDSVELPDGLSNRSLAPAS